MRLLAYLLIVVSLVSGCLAATTAYAPRVAAVTASGQPLTLAAPAGRNPAQPDEPAVTPGDARNPTRLTADVASRLAALNVSRVRVKEFALARWDHAWVFGLSVAGVVLGGLLVRRDAQRQMGARAAATGSRNAPPHAWLDAAHRDIEALLREVAPLPEEQQPAEILRRVEAIQESALAPFVDARPELMGRFGVAGFARVMDPFAAAERQLNRAWSAAADHAVPEAVASLENALVSVAAARARITDPGAP